MNRIKTLIHLHTDYSPDSSLSCETLARFAEREGIGCVAVTDHDTIDGALHLRSMTDVTVVIGEEISTSQGDLIGLFLSQCVPPGMSARDTARAIKDQGGLVLLPHPFIKVFGCGLREVAWELVDLVDAVEVCNAQNIYSVPDRAAERYADELHLAKFAGSDTHEPSSIAPCYQLMADCSGPAAFLDSLRSAELVRGRHPLSYFVSAAYRTVRALMGMSFPKGCGRNAIPAQYPHAEPSFDAPGA